MSTRSRIGIQLSDESILSVYHHWDGYPSGVGVELKEHYTTKESVSDLINGGNMSSCWTMERWDDEDNQEYGPMYYTQRGESIEETQPRHDTDLNEYLSDGAEYAYLFVNDEWVCYKMNTYASKLPTEIVEIPQAVTVE